MASSLKDKLPPEPLRRIERQYAGHADRPLGSYAVLLGIYASYVGALVTVAAARRVRLPEQLRAADLALVTVGTYRASRLISKDSVTSVARAPFTEFDEAAGGNEVNEDARGRGFRHAAGELVSCPFCLAVWLATAGAFGMVTFPRATRLICSVLAAVTGSDVLQYGHDALQKTE